ncbi:type III-D CRISPR-associated RAMP protein Csx10 [Merismopedia glauca]|uniref:CRISPR-associated RAMP protein Csx10 n=1 Tax=Merismopedia glauca CCAP 1448/3 TaxID=1296344 RepID=A0A2T1BZV4_9CYAN|nr:CRISPR-associated RAMP protein Csx10 [Merismopedia glauca]PSB01555.1 CRISPR-associated RAMP protein Csx10 [Merismopedia glauca CCAP 1448/3]
MYKIQLTITALSPLAIGRKKPGSVSEASDYIPGSVIRGAIASELIQRLGQPAPGDDFYSLFLDENYAIFSNAYPATAKGKKEQNKEYAIIAEEVRILPATAVSSKTQPGFKTAKGNGVFDTLIDNFCAESRDLFYDPSCPTAIEKGNDGRVEPYTGFYSKFYSKLGEYKYYTHSVSKRLLTRVGINRRRATSEEEILYSIEVLNEQFSIKRSLQLVQWESTIYKSCISIETDEDLANKIIAFINGNSEAFRLGGSTSRGLGRVKIEAIQINNENKIEERINNFNQKLRERWHEWSVLGKPRQNLTSERTFFTINLEADAILTENWRRTTVISEEMLCQFANLEELKKDLKLHATYSSYDYLSGWNSAWGLMKDVELVTNKGSVYLFSISANRTNQWIEALSQLKMKGVGDRTSEGFGQIEICSEFHQIFRKDVK